MTFIKTNKFLVRISKEKANLSLKTFVSAFHAVVHQAGECLCCNISHHSHYLAQDVLSCPTTIILLLIQVLTSQFLDQFLYLNCVGF